VNCPFRFLGPGCVSIFFGLFFFFFVSGGGGGGGGRCAIALSASRARFCIQFFWLVV